MALSICRAGLGIAALIVTAAAVRVAAFDFVTDDLRLWVFPWFEHLDSHGYRALGADFPNVHGDTGGNYAPPYYYLLYPATFFNSFIPNLYLIKIVSVVFDCIAALVMFLLARRVTRSSRLAWFGAGAVLFAPTVVANGALWGQCDVIPASLLLASVYFAIADRPGWTLALFAFAVSVKAVGVFLAPFILMLLLRRAIPLRLLPAAPAAWIIAIGPAWILGRSITDLLSIYLSQAGLYRSLSMDAANLYYFIPDRFYEVGVMIGLGVTIVAGLLFALLPIWRRVPLSFEFLLVSATLSVTMAPFLLPKMHDRYFMPADLISVALGICYRKWWFVPVLCQVASALAYIPILEDSVTGSGGYRGLTPVAVALNCALFGILAWQYWRAVRLTAPDGGTRA